MVLVTGGTGFVGKILLRELIKSGEDLRLLSRRKVEGVESVICDFQTDEIPLDSLKNIDTIFHLAGFAHDFKDASKIENIYKHINIQASVALAELAVKNKVTNFIFVSSVKAGGTSIKGICSSEDDQREPEGIYGKTKRDAELKILEIGRQSSMNVVVIRSSLVYGPKVKGNLRKMFLGIQKGWFPPLPETGNTRSMIHVDDLVRVLLFVAKDDRTNGEIYIATDGIKYSSCQIYEILSSISGKKTPNWKIPIFLFSFVALLSPKIRYKVKKLLGDECYSSKKLKSLGFKPHFTLQEMNETNL